VKQLSISTGCSINISPRLPGMQERLVQIVGEYRGLINAVNSVNKIVQSDAHMQGHVNITYDINLPPGAWSADGFKVANRNVPLIHMDDTHEYTKRQLIEYLKMAAPHEILMKYCLLVSVQRAMKVKKVSELAMAVKETYQLRRVLGECYHTQYDLVESSVHCSQVELHHRCAMQQAAPIAWTALPAVQRG